MINTDKLPYFDADFRITQQEMETFAKNLLEVLIETRNEGPMEEDKFRDFVMWQLDNHYEDTIPRERDEE